MAEKEKKEEVVLSEREQLWQEFVANYEKANPVKYASKRATSFVDPITGATVAKKDELAVPPANFQGKKRVRQQANGKTIVEIY